jgi:stage III sporulation protein AB
LKVVGAVIVIAAASACGEQKARALALRVQHLQQFRRALALLAAEISFTRPVLPYAFKTAAERSSFPARELLLEAAVMLLAGGELTAREIWKKAVDRVLPETCCTAADREIIESLGASLGVCEQEGQLNQIRLTMSQLDCALEEALGQKHRSEKMWRYLGFAGGAALVIFFL